MVSKKEKMKNMIELDGGVGEGGGQILRTALALSMITQTPFRITNIRAKRPKPGLLRQHLTCVRAAAEVSDAQVEGAELGAVVLTFSPKAIRGGDYAFAIGTAGSVTLVLQTILPALLFANEPSTVALDGGTHNGMSPPFEFIERSFLPLLARMGAHARVSLLRHGFYPAGGGKVAISIAPVAARRLSPLTLASRGAQQGAFAESIIANVPGSVAKRELAAVRDAFKWPEEALRIRGLDAAQGPGNALLITLQHAEVTEVFIALGEKNVTSETVAARAIAEAKAYLASPAAVGEYLADQLMIPFALVGAGSYTATCVSDHARTNAGVIEAFLPVKIDFADGPGGTTRFSFSGRA